jgi:hypothetical protein
MPLRLFLVLLLVITPFALADEPPHTKYGFQRMREADFLPRAQYRLSFLRTEPDKHYGRIGLFTFRHTLDHPLKLFGFGFQKDGSLRVRFEQFSRRQDNRWQEVRVGYCGTGAQSYALDPNRDYLLRVPLWPFTRSGDRGVVLLSGDRRILSDEFDTAPLRVKGAATHKPRK